MCRKESLRVFAATNFTSEGLKVQQTYPSHHAPAVVMVTHGKGWGSFSRRDYDDSGGGVFACHSFSPGPSLFSIGSQHLPPTSVTSPGEARVR